MSNLHDTQPSRPIKLKSERGVNAPPKFLFWGIIGLFILIIIGTLGWIYAFQNVLLPSQQQRVIDQLPFMSRFLPPTPEGGILPTVAPADNGANAMDLLNMPVGEPTATAEATDEAEMTPEVQPTDEPTPVSMAVTPTATAIPTLVSTATLQPTDVPQATSQAPINNSSSTPLNARIFGIQHQQQRWNNCGPANITMALSYYGWQQDQTFAASFLKPNREDKNVSPFELVQFVEEQTDLDAIWRMGGDIDLLKTLVANEFPVVIETGAMFEAYDWIGHYRTLVAFDDTFQTMYFFDSFLGVGEGAQGVTELYRDVDANWQAFNRTFIVLYEPSREGQLQRLLGERWTPEGAAEHAFAVAQAEARAKPQNPFTWFNMGTSLVALDRHQEAATAFDQAIRLEELPFRMLWYQFGPFEAYFRQGTL